MSSQAAQPLDIAPVMHRRSSASDEVMVLSDVYQEQCNIAVWQRSLSPSIESAVDLLLKEKPQFRTSMTLSPENAFEPIHESFGSAPALAPLSEDIAQLVDMFCCLFDLGRAGLRITALTSAMCPKFHVDKVPCRLVTTYRGVATQWLPHSRVDRTKLGHGSQGKSDEESGLISSLSDIQQLTSGDVALLKGERWQGNEGGGLVHRSPPVPSHQERLLLTLDFG
ncbi:DUF1826 domain-containing protein [Paraferrimonas sedimenticola]|uniref:Succinylglutamate desuccinylase n=1 Tax=Paraferrimonas sedimenticola TaxID=375674 RepID=A0AA37RWE8_9GAMM|nr:DUF1826 domain-containing protein [Paraferrimonas sedimenticola]GLP96570.1 hypothetical protein GCM10007895_18760 [Paraferrimonas sedimenticola]